MQLLVRSASKVSVVGKSETHQPFTPSAFAHLSQLEQDNQGQNMQDCPVEIVNNTCPHHRLNSPFTGKPDGKRACYCDCWAAAVQPISQPCDQAVCVWFCVSAGQFIKQKLPDLLRSYVDADLGGNQEGGFQDIAIEVLHLLLSHLLFGQKGASGVGQEQIDAFLKTLCRGIEAGPG